MSYFKNFPTIVYSFDTGNLVNTFIMTDILRRVRADDVNIANVLSYDEYDIGDDETPEILADKLYGDPALHWVILISNEILDPRWDWPLPVQSLQNVIARKYGMGNEFGVHHYENTTGDTVYYRVYTGTASASATSAGSSISITGTDTAWSTELYTGLTIRFGVTTTSYTVTRINSNTSISVSGSAITTGGIVNATVLNNNSVTGSVTAITNTDYETLQNESRRRIRLLKPEYVPQFVQNFTGILNNGQ